MTFKKACELYNGDEVIIKSTGEIGIVKSAYSLTSPKCVLIDVVVGNKLFREMLHTELN